MAYDTPVDEKVKRAFIASIESTEDPLAPIKLEKAYLAVTSLGAMFAQKKYQASADEYTKRLLKDFPDDDELDKVCTEPGFLIALSGLFVAALGKYVSRLANRGEPWSG